jgi:hypothetical protein
MAVGIEKGLFDWICEDIWHGVRMGTNIVFIFCFAQNDLNLGDVVKIFINNDWNMGSLKQ